MITSDDIKRRLWAGANELRGSMDASRYKDYMLGLMFYKFLSDKTLERFRTVLTDGLSEQEVFEKYEEYAQNDGDSIYNFISLALGYYVKPQYLYQSWLRDIERGEFELQKLTDSFQQFERTISSAESGNDFHGLFSTSTIDLSDTALGSNLHERSNNVKRLVLLFADLNMVDLQKGDVLGDAYEYLIGMFALESGKKAGEFYTPRQVSEVMAQIVAKSGPIKTIYDPTVGSGSLLLTVSRHLSPKERELLDYAGQEKNTATYNLTRMNLLLHGVRPDRMCIRNGDTLGEDWPEDPRKPDQGTLFDAIVMNPPYSLKNWNRYDLKVSDPRFQIAGILPPQSKGDYAFLLHGLYHLGPEGTMAIVLPHGVLFRGASEGQIRERLLSLNYIDTIVGLPANMFTNTGIPVIVMILKKNRNHNDPLLFIDASKDFVKRGKQNALEAKDIAKIVDCYLERKEIKGYSHLASKEEILANEFNLNIPRYIASLDEEIPQDVDAHLYGGLPEKNIKDLEVLNRRVPQVLANNLRELRPGYLKLNCSLEDLRKAVLNSQQVNENAKRLRNDIQVFSENYFERLKAFAKIEELNPLMEEMLLDIRQLLKDYEDVDVYDGYQVIAELWERKLSADLEKIAIKGFYETGRSREARMITKGSGRSRREVQEGFEGSIVPKELLAEKLFHEENDAIKELETHLSSLNTEIEEILEAAKEENSDEASALEDVINASGTGFKKADLQRELNAAEAGSSEREILEKVNLLNEEKSTLERKIKAKEKKLEQEVEERILKLTDAEIDLLVFDKWFGNIVERIVDLINKPLIEELELIEILQERYGETLDDLDAEIAAVTEELEAMMQELVITNEEA